MTVRGAIDMEFDSEPQPRPIIDSDKDKDGGDLLSDDNYNFGSLNPKFSDSHSAQVPRLITPRRLRDFFAHRDRVGVHEPDHANDKPQVMEQHERVRESEPVSASGNENTNTAKSTTTTATGLNMNFIHYWFANANCK